jgi:hypothetical protein
MEDTQLLQTGCEASCPPCPSGSLRNGKTFEVQIQNLPTICLVEFLDTIHSAIQCNAGIKINEGSCEELVEITLCEGTSSEQTLTCCLPMDYLALSGELEIFFNILGTCDSDCLPEPQTTYYHAVTTVPIDELCFYCEGTRPTIINGDLCNYFSITIDSVSATGLITYTVQFLNCPAPLV